MEEISKSANPVLNEAYFGPAPVPNAVPGTARPGPSSPAQPGSSPK
jgi:hypothetical protein